MPELPEVETIRRDLVQVVGRRIESVVIDGARTVRRHSADQLIQGAIGRTVTDVRRIGKSLLIDLGHEVTVAVHLRMSGRLRWFASDDVPIAPHTHAQLRFHGGGQLHFIDPRTFGELWLTTGNAPELAHFGPDALDGLLSVQVLDQRLAGRRRQLKSLLLDQRVVAGIGNIYADEALFRARLRPDRLAVTLGLSAVARLHGSIQEVLREAVASRGTSLRDQQYVDLFGQPGKMKMALRVHDRAGQACLVCEQTIERVTIDGRSSYFCRRCQR